MGPPNDYDPQHKNHWYKVLISKNVSQVLSTIYIDHYFFCFISIKQDFIINIDSTTLTLIQYENWLCIPEKGTLSGEFNAIER